MFATCRAKFSADPQYTTFAAKHLHPVVTLVGYRAHNRCSYGRTILHDMKPTCPTCNHRMSPPPDPCSSAPVAGSLSSFSMSGLSIIHCRGGKSTRSDLPNIKPTHGFNARAHKSKPPPVEPTGVSNKVDNERRALKPGGPSRTLADHKSRSCSALQSY